MSKHKKEVLRKIEQYYEEIGPICSIANYDKRARRERLPVYFIQKKVEVGEEVIECDKFGRFVHDFSDFNFCPYCGEAIFRKEI